jgi:hypothetical protein
MPRGKLRPKLAEVKALLSEEQDFLRPLVQALLQELLEARRPRCWAPGRASGRRSGSATGPDTTRAPWSPGLASWS